MKIMRKRWTEKRERRRERERRGIGNQGFSNNQNVTSCQVLRGYRKAEMS